MKSGKQRRTELDAKRKARRDRSEAEHAEATRATRERDAASGGPMNPEFANKTRPSLEDYIDYVEHPRYGKAPRFTGSDPDPNSPTVRLHWNTQYLTKGQRRSYERTLGKTSPFLNQEMRLVPGTAIAADLSRQTPSMVSVTHYYDIDEACLECGRRFIFFAEEQKYWYEELGFPLSSQAVRCPSCRKRLQQIARMRRRYEQLSHLSVLNDEETLEMADCCLTLIEEAIFHLQQCEHVRMLLKRVPEDRQADKKFLEMTARLVAVAKNAQGEGAEAHDRTRKRI